MAVHALFGFGEGLMSGELDADEFYSLKQSGELHRTLIARKIRQLTRQTASDVSTIAVSPEKQTASCLINSQLTELFRLGATLEKAFQHPQDIEFLVTDTQIFVVQSRPITQPIPAIIVYDNSNIQEGYCGVTTPLTFSFASRAHTTVVRADPSISGQTISL